MVKGNGLQGKPNIQEGMLRDSRKVMDNFTFRAGIFIKAILSMTKEKGMVKCFGLMVLSIKGIGRGEFKMGKDKFTFLEDK